MNDVPTPSPSHSVARQWNEVLLEAIRRDFARPTVHARNLYHVSAAMWDAWAAYVPSAEGVFFIGSRTAENVSAAQNEAISYASYRLIKHRFANSPGAEKSLPLAEAKMAELGYDPDVVAIVGDTPAALGNHIAGKIIEFGLSDGSQEQVDYEAPEYLSVNRFHVLIPKLTGNSGIRDPNRWQPLALDLFVDQAGNQLDKPPSFLGPHWGDVTPFALDPESAEIYERGGVPYRVYNDPGPPPIMGGVGDDEYHDGFMQVVEWSSLLDPRDGNVIDISPASQGNNSLGANDGAGYELNPITGSPYTPHVVPTGDYYRVIAEFWADGPDSETPPGHWFGIANMVSDHPMLVKRLAGRGEIVDDLEWDVKLYLTLGGAVHDAAIAAWSVKGWHDYVRPISAVRFMARWGQRDNPKVSDYDPRGVKLKPGMVEVVTKQSIEPAERHAHLGPLAVGRIAVYAWLGPDAIDDPETDYAGVGWMLLEEWWPYQRPTFVTPPFAGYVSGHSTFSRAAAEVLTAFTGDPYFPGGLGKFPAIKNRFLVFEEGPSTDVTLQWATYRDAADESAISRIYGGIHPRADDFPGRVIGEKVGKNAYSKASSLFD